MDFEAIIDACALCRLFDRKCARHRPYTKIGTKETMPNIFCPICFENTKHSVDDFKNNPTRLHFVDGVWKQRSQILANPNLNPNANTNQIPNQTSLFNHNRGNKHMNNPHLHLKRNNQYTDPTYNYGID